MKHSKAIITGMLILLTVILLLFAARQLNEDTDQQQKMEAGIFRNPARDRLEDSVQQQQQQAEKIANYIRAWKEFEDNLRDQFYGYLHDK
jgi:competence protein ComGF